MEEVFLSTRLTITFRCPIILMLRDKLDSRNQEEMLTTSTSKQAKANFRNSEER